MGKERNTLGGHEGTGEKQRQDQGKEKNWERENVPGLGHCVFADALPQSNKAKQTHINVFS